MGDINLLRRKSPDLTWIILQMGKTKIVYPLELLCEIVYELKKEGKRICLTHGAFDLFHFSHLDLLQKSADISDFLIVGVDSDERVADYKRYKRPIIKQVQRMEIINSIHCVDAAFVKDIPLSVEEHTSLYKELMVDIVTIGYHFYFEDVIEEQVKKAGAKLVKLPTVQNPTTTSIINSIIETHTESNYQELPRADS